MKKVFKLSQSIYSEDKYNGLSVRNGRLVNNRPDGQTGIAQASQVRKSMKQAEKVSMIAKGVAMGDIMSDMGDCYGCD
jgi:hypothetical protein